MHHPTDRIAHTTAFVTPVVEHWLEREIAQWVHPMKDRYDDPSHHEQTLLPWSYISLLPIKGCSSFIDCKAWRHESESVKTMYLALTIALISAVKMYAESGNLMEIMVFDGKTVAQATEFPFHEPYIYKQECDHGTSLVFP